MKTQKPQTPKTPYKDALHNPWKLTTLVRCWYKAILDYSYLRFLSIKDGSSLSNWAERPSFYILYPMKAVLFSRELIRLSISY